MSAPFAADLIRRKIDKAKEFLVMAEFALESEMYDAAASLAISAAINASDALAMRELKRIPRHDTHDDAVRVLRKGGLDQAAQALTRCLGVKNKAQYSTEKVSRTEANATLKRANRLVDFLS